MAGHGGKLRRGVLSACAVAAGAAFCHGAEPSLSSVPDSTSKGFIQPCQVTARCPPGTVDFDLGPYTSVVVTPAELGASDSQNGWCFQDSIIRLPEFAYLSVNDIGGPRVVVPNKVFGDGIAGGGTSTCAIFVRVFTSAFEGEECQFNIDGVFESVPVEGGTGVIDVQASDCECEWTAESHSPWLRIVGSGSGVGDGAVVYEADPFEAGEDSMREGIITVAGRIVTVTQLPFCPWTVPDYVIAPRSESSILLPVDLGVSCDYEVFEDAPWFSIVKDSDSGFSFSSGGLSPIPRGGRAQVAASGGAGRRSDCWLFYQGPANGEDLLSLSYSRDLWHAKNRGGVYDRMGRTKGVGYAHGPASGHQTLTADLDGNGLGDVVNISPGGYVWRVLATGDGGFGENEHVLTASLEVDSSGGKGVLAADVNGDGFDELVQVGPSAVFVLPNDAGTLASQPTETFDGVAWDFAAGYEVLVADLDGDGSQDLAAIDPNGDVTRIPLSGPDAGMRLPFGNIGRFTENPAEGASCSGVQILAGDFDGDGTDDLCAIFEGGVETAYSNGASLDAPMLHGTLGFRFAPYDGEGWFVLAGDVDGDGMADLVQLAPNGDVWTVRSTGTAFGAPFKNGITGFHHRPEGPWQTFLVNLYE